MNKIPFSNTENTVRQALKSTFENTINQLNNSSPEFLAFSLSESSWTAAEIFEHVSLTNHFLLLLISKHTEKAIKRAQTEQIASRESDLTIFEKFADSSSFSWSRPDHMAPTGTKTKDEIINKLLEQNQKCAALLNDLQGGKGSLAAITMSVQNLGKLDLYQWLYFIALHMQRHITQIDKLRAAFSKSPS